MDFFRLSTTSLEWSWVKFTRWDWQSASELHFRCSHCSHCSDDFWQRFSQGEPDVCVWRASVWLRDDLSIHGQPGPCRRGQGGDHDGDDQYDQCCRWDGNVWSFVLFTNIMNITLDLLIAVVIIINLVLCGDLTFGRCTPRWGWPGAGGRAGRSAGWSSSWSSRSPCFQNQGRSWLPCQLGKPEWRNTGISHRCHCFCNRDYHWMMTHSL